MGLTPKNALQPEIGGDLLRVHRALSRAVDLAQKHATLYAKMGYPDSQTRKGYLTYVRCLVSLLHAHHVTEDKAIFPYLHDKLPNAPYDDLRAQHNAMGPILNEIKGILRDAAFVKPSQLINTLPRPLARINQLWSDHIQLEEAHLGPDAVGAVMTMEERIRAGKFASNYAARHQFPLSLMIPFLLYNLPPHDREIMLKLMPGFIPLMLVVWKPRWKIMAPFLWMDV
jgi:hemerythrin-like domain-containing protein